MGSLIFTDNIDDVIRAVAKLESTGNSAKLLENQERRYAKR